MLTLERPPLAVKLLKFFTETVCRSPRTPHIHKLRIPGYMWSSTYEVGHFSRAPKRNSQADFLSGIRKISVSRNHSRKPPATCLWLSLIHISEPTRPY